MEREKTKMSNSPLVSYTKLSPNHSGKRNHVIDTITIHCMAGNASVETCGALFANPSRKASSNYGIGSDGRIALYVDEANRSWCSSSSSNDNRAITIEVANNGGTPDWPVSYKAYAALLDLVTDICKRNGIKKLVWSTNKNDRINHKNGCNMTIHRDFSNKSCPGDYLYNRHGQIATEVNKRLEGEEEVDIAKLISEMTNEQAYQLMQKAEFHAKTLDEPAWSKNEGHWAKATKTGIVDGSSPERPMKRDEVIAVLGRKNLI